MAPLCGMRRTPPKGDRSDGRGILNLSVYDREGAPILM
jgi:hypothetical protein